MGRIKPRKVSELMDIANRFADGEDACNNKRTRSPEDNRGNRYGSQRRRSCNYDNYGSHSQVAAGYKDNNYQGDDHRNSGYCSYDKEDSSCGDPGLPPGIPVMHTIHDPRKTIVNPHNRVGITDYTIPCIASLKVLHRPLGRI
jgi:hypothetical protein